MTRLMIYSLVITVVGLSFYRAVWAKVIVTDNQSTQNIMSTQQPLSKKEITALAAQWGITPKEYTHYQEIMQHTPSGKWYRQLDPAEVLALNSQNEKDMRHYARIEAKLMHAKVSKELLLSRLYRQAYRQLYPNQRPIELTGQALKQRPPLSLQAGDHIWLFTKLSDVATLFILPSLIEKITTTPGTALDIYFVGKHLTRQQIQQWAATQQLNPSLVSQHRITLNQGNARFHALAQGKTLELPYVGLVHQRQWHEISLSELSA